MTGPAEIPLCGIVKCVELVVLIALPIDVTEEVVEEAEVDDVAVDTDEEVAIDVEVLVVDCTK